MLWELGQGEALPSTRRRPCGCPSARVSRGTPPSSDPHLSPDTCTWQTKTFMMKVVFLKKNIYIERERERLNFILNFKMLIWGVLFSSINHSAALCLKTVKMDRKNQVIFHNPFNYKALELFN